MKLLFKQRFFSWLDSYDIFDEQGNSVYTVEGKLSWGHCLKIFDAYRNEVGMVKEVVLTFLPKFEIYQGGNFVGTISKEFTFFKPKFNIDFNGWQIEGEWMEWDYRITDSVGRVVASVSKELFRMTDAYVIDVDRKEDVLCALMFVLAMDAEKCSRN